MKEHFLAAQGHTHDRWSRDLAPVLTIASGDTVVFECLDSSGGQVGRNSTVEDFVKIDRMKIHTLTGPVAIAGAELGDTLSIEVRRVRHGGWGWSSIIGGLGFLPERFSDLFFMIWDLEESVTRSLAPAVLPLAPFPGIMGVAPAEPGQHRTRPPGIFGGNLDIRDLSEGAILHLPVQVSEALFSTGDCHAAQGNGEVCINGIECPAEVTLRFTLRKNAAPLPGPWLETPAGRPHPAPAGEWIFAESAEHPTDAARRAVSRAVDFLAAQFHLPPERAYVLCSVALHLRLAQVVNAPLTTVVAALPRHLFPT